MNSEAGLDTALAKPLLNAGMINHLSKHTTYCCLEEASVAARLGVVRGFNALNQLEFMHIYSNSGVKVPERARSQYAGSNRGNVLGPIVLPALGNSWTMTFGDKKLLYGKNRRAVGGRTVDGAAPLATEGEDAADAAADDAVMDSLVPPSVSGGNSTARSRANETLEPVFYRVMPLTFYQEMLQSMRASAVLDLTAGDGTLALAAIMLKIPYCGVCFSDMHVETLMGHLIAEVLTMFADPENKLYQPTLAALKKQGALPGGRGKEDQQPRAGGGRGRGKRGGAAPKPKPSKKHRVDGANSGGKSDADPDDDEANSDDDSGESESGKST